MSKKTDRRRRIFSISQEFEEDVNYILDNTPNYSRFVCEAIIEKYNKDNNPDNTLENKVREVLLNIMSSNEMFQGKEIQSLNTVKSEPISDLENIKNEAKSDNIQEDKINILENKPIVKENSNIIKKDEITKEDVLGHELEDNDNSSESDDKIVKISKKAFDNW